MSHSVWSRVGNIWSLLVQRLIRRQLTSAASRLHPSHSAAEAQRFRELSSFNIHNVWRRRLLALVHASAFTLKYIKSIRYCSKYCKHRCKNWRTLPTFLHFQQNVPLSLLGMIQGIGYPDKLGANGGWLSKPGPRSHDSANNGAAALLVTRTGDKLTIYTLIAR